jgi:hypothetical protein
VEDWLLAVVLGVGIPAGILAFLAGFLALLYSIFAQTSGWNALTHRYEAIVEPEGRKLTRQTIKVGSVRWRWCVTVVLNVEGMYIQLGRQTGLLAIRKHPPVLIPWAEFKAPRKGRLYLGWEAVQLSIGEQETAAITFPIELYKEMVGYLNISTGAAVLR